MNTTANALTLVGTIAEMPMHDHDYQGETFYRFMLAVQRQSGILDTLPVMVSEHLLNAVSPHIGQDLRLEGQVRSYNKMVDGAGRLCVVAFAQRLAPATGGRNLNEVALSGALCKQPEYRTTPFGREITDMMLAVNRSFGRSDYIPCIVWGRNAQYAARLEVGDHITVDGRLQSRAYEKQRPDGSRENRAVYEVSIRRLEKWRDTTAPRARSD